MRENIPFFIITIEISAIVALMICGIGFVALIAYRNLAPVPIVAQVTRAAVRTPLPTAARTPTLVPSPIPTITATPDPRVTVTSCLQIDSSGIYVLDADITAISAGDCIKIQASRVTLDCAGHQLRGIGFNGNGIAVRKHGWLADSIVSDVEIKNCRVSNFRFGIYAESGTRLSIHDNDSSNNYDDTDAGTRYGKFLGLTDGGGIRLDNNSGSTIMNNTTLTQAIGIDIRSSTNITVSGNTSSNNSAWGIDLIKTQGSIISGNITADNIRQCTWGAGVIGYGCDAGGIMLQDTVKNNVIKNNQVIGRNGNGIFIKSHGLPCGDNNSIIGNTVAGALYNSIELAFCTGNKVNDNTFRDGLDAVWLGFAHGNEIKGNVIVNMKNHGIISSNSYNNTVSGNHITDSNVGVYFSSDDYNRDFFYFLSPNEDYTSHDNCLCGNVFHGNNVAIQLKDSTFNQITNNDFRGNARGLVMAGHAQGNNTQGNQ